MPRTVRDHECYINDNTIKDLIAAHLYATAALADDEEVLELHLGDPTDGLRAIKYKFIKTKEVELIVHA